MRIGIIGHFGGNKKFNDGQTVKTVSLYEGLKDLKVGNIDKIDTYYTKTNKLKFIMQFLICIFRDTTIIVLPSKNGRRVLFPILSFLSLYLKKRIFHYAIGGRLGNEVSNNNKYRAYVNSFAANWMESRTLVKQLKLLGVTNACYMPNFKNINVISLKEMNTRYNKPFRFCTFSRVMKNKGIIDAIESVAEVNLYNGHIVAILDIYGPVDEKFKVEFDEKCQQFSAFVTYKGVSEPNNSVNVLKDYYCLLFPTRWQHEGIPGTIIDAMSAGVPVLARRWKYCDEMIKDEWNGLVYNFDEPEKLKEKINFAIHNESLILNMKINCLAKAREYSKDNVLKRIVEELGI